MITKLLHQKRILFCFKLWVLVGVFSMNAQENSASPLEIVQKVVPNAYATTNGNVSFLGPLSNAPRTYQLLIAASELTDLVGKSLISLSYRNLSSATAAWPTSDVTFTNYDIYLSGSVNPADRSFTFANNIVGTQTLVRSGSLVIPANSLSFGNTPNTFSFDINFTTPWTYAGGNVLVEIRHTGFTGTSRSVDAAGTSTTGYGTLYSACWNGNYTATTTTTQGNFSIINFRADDALNTNDFSKNKIAVYPNPASESLFIESEVAVKKMKLYNMIGQLVLEKGENQNNNSISIEHLNSGTYLLQIETELGISNKKIVKE